MAGKAPFHLLPKHPFSLLPQKKKNPYIKAYYTSLQGLQIKHLNRVHFTFDPFHPQVDSIRDLLFHLTTVKVRKTNPKCLFKTSVVCDRREPQIEAKLENGEELLYKTSNLTSLEILNHLKATLARFEQPPEDLLK